MRECWVSFTVLSAALSCSCEGDSDMWVVDAGGDGESDRLCLSSFGKIGDEEDGGVKGDGVGAGGVEGNCIDGDDCVSWA